LLTGRILMARQSVYIRWETVGTEINQPKKLSRLFLAWHATESRWIFMANLSGIDILVSWIIDLLGV